MTPETIARLRASLPPATVRCDDCSGFGGGMITGIEWTCPHCAGAGVVEPDSSWTVAECRALLDALDAAQRERDALLDIPLARLQFPDGSVPTGTVACAEGWYRVAQEAMAERDTLHDLSQQAVDTATRLRGELEVQESQKEAFAALAEKQLESLKTIQAERDAERQRAEAAEGQLRTFLVESRNLLERTQAAEGERDRLREHVRELAEDLIRHVGRVSPLAGGWWDTCAWSAARDAGETLVAMGLWERHPDGHGRRWFYRPKGEGK